MSLEDFTAERKAFLGRGWATPVALDPRTGLVATAAHEEDIRQSIWAKLAQNLWSSTLCTLTGVTVREVQDRAALKPLAGQAIEEATAIARALGVAVERAPRRPSGKSSSGAAHKPSMLQDYERGRPMEVEAQLMAPLALARAAKVHTPLLEVLVPLVAAKAAARGLYEH